MIVAPALGIGGLVIVVIVFALGFLSTSGLLTFLKNRSKKAIGADKKYPTHQGKIHWINRMEEKHIEWISIAGGLFFVVILVILFLKSPISQRLPIIILLTVIGILASVLSFLFSGFRSNGNSAKPYASQKQGSNPSSDNEHQKQKEELERTLQELTRTLIWDWGNFRGVLICLAMLGEGRHIPAGKRPDRISLDGLKSTFDELRELSVQRKGRETSRAVFVDKIRRSLVISGKTVVGSSNKVRIDMGAEPGREILQIPVLTIHVHPGKDSEVGLSDIDYISFLTDPRQIVMMVCIQDGILFAMKTSSTPRIASQKTVNRWISDVKKDIESIWSNMQLPQAILAFNKAICMEFGMTLYQTLQQDPNNAGRIEVVDR
jgi:hypothetical protein